MGMEYYIILGDECVEGPFPTKAEARRRAASLTTYEVGLHYRIRAKPTND